jgi:hypothetical protein
MLQVGKYRDTYMTITAKVSTLVLECDRQGIASDTGHLIGADIAQWAVRALLLEVDVF